MWTWSKRYLTCRDLSSGEDVIPVVPPLLIPPPVAAGSLSQLMLLSTSPLTSDGFCLVNTPISTCTQSRPQDHVAQSTPPRGHDLPADLTSPAPDRRRPTGSTPPMVAAASTSVGRQLVSARKAAGSSPLARPPALPGHPSVARLPLLCAV